MPLKLVFGSLEYNLTHTRLRLGRADRLEVSVSGDPLVSSHHCIIEDGTLIDTQSTNGTMINNMKIPYQKPRQLNAGDVITLGETNLLVVEGLPYDKSGTASNSSASVNSSTAFLSAMNRPSNAKKHASLNRPLKVNRVKSSSHSNDGVQSVPASQPGTRLSSPTNANRSLNASQSQQADQSLALPAPSSNRSSSQPALALSRVATQLRMGTSLFNTSAEESFHTNEGLIDTSRNRDADTHTNNGSDDARNGRLHLPAFLDDSRLVDSSASRDDSHNIESLHFDTDSPLYNPNDANDVNASHSKIHLGDSHSNDLNASHHYASMNGDTSHHSLSLAEESTQLRSALRQAEIKHARLEKKLSDARRKSSAAPRETRADMENRSRITAYEMQIAGLEFQLLYGQSSKDAEIDKMKQELEHWKHDKQSTELATNDADKLNGTTPVTAESLDDTRVAHDLDTSESLLAIDDLLTHFSHSLNGTKTELLTSLKTMNEHSLASLASQLNHSINQMQLQSAQPLLTVAQELSQSMSEMRQELCQLSKKLDALQSVPPGTGYLSQLQSQPQPPSVDKQVQQVWLMILALVGLTLALVLVQLGR